MLTLMKRRLDQFVTLKSHKEHMYNYVSLYLHNLCNIHVVTWQDFVCANNTQVTLTYQYR